MAATMTPGNAGTEDCFAVIKFIEEPPKQLFVNQEFDLGISILMPRSRALSSTSSTSTIQLRPRLYRFTRGKISSLPVAESDNVQLIMDPPLISFPLSETGSPSEHITRAKCKISCHALQSSKPSAFIIRFNAEPDPIVSFEIKQAFSQPLSLVNAKLSVESPNWEDVWYKDMGGRDKAILAMVSLIDSKGNIVTNRKIPLQLKLLYDNENKTSVANDAIFRVIGASSYHIDPETGKAPLQFRIEDVSKNHQGQNFLIEVSADNEKCPDIATGYSRSVCIRSKKKKDLGSRKRPIANASTPAQKKHPPAQNVPPQPPKPFPQPQFTVPIADPFMLGSAQNAQQVRKAMRGIIKWTQEVVNGLGPLKWNVIGYAQNPEGVIDYSRPYHSMPNPNEKVNQILNMYAEDTREHLRVILDAVETSTGPSASGDTNYGSVHHSTTISTHSGQPAAPVHPPHLGQTNITALNQASGPGVRPLQWQSTYPEHPSYPTRGLICHEESVMSPQAHQNAPLGQTGTGSTMPPLHPPPMQNQYWGQQHNRDIPHTPHGENHHPQINDHDEPDMSEIAIDLETRQADVQYVYAKVFKSLLTDQHLGFPAYNIVKELLGFYREADADGESGRFVPIHLHRDEFGQEEMDQASRILKDAILKHNRAVYALNDWNSLSDMVEHALVSKSPKDFERGNPNLSVPPPVDIGNLGRDYL